MDPAGKGARGVSDLHSKGVSLPNQISRRGGPQMANRRFEMHEIRQGIVQMRPGLTEGQIAKAGLTGRGKTS